MAKDLKLGVVESDRRPFGHMILFVAGARVFTAAAPTSPTDTVADPALRTAKAIEQQLAGGR